VIEALADFWMRADKNNPDVASEHALELLLSAIPDDSAHFRQLCNEVENWDDVLHSALLHGVESLLYHHLIEIGFTLPPAIEDRVLRWQMIKDLWQAHAQSALDETLRVLDSASVRAVALKGPVLGERLYPDPRMRVSADLDLLVASDDLERATAALKTVGYGAAKESQARFLRKYHYHTILRRSCPPVIELHFRLSDGFGVAIASEEFLTRARAYRTTQGAVAGILSPEDEMLYLSIHAAGHRFVRLSWLCDIKLLLRHYPDLDWTTLIARARSLHVLAALLFTCETLRSRVGVKIPLNAAMPQRIRSRIANLLLAATAKQPDPSRRSLLGKMAFTAVLCDRPGGALDFLQRQLLLIARRRAHRHFPSLTPEEWAF
jgi:hypothetical protein